MFDYEYIDCILKIILNKIKHTKFMDEHTLRAFANCGGLFVDVALP